MIGFTTTATISELIDKKTYTIKKETQKKDENALQRQFKGCTTPVACKKGKVTLK